jgi:hypothetical protein
VNNKKTRKNNKKQYHFGLDFALAEQALQFVLEQQRN